MKDKNKVSKSANELISSEKQIISLKGSSLNLDKQITIDHYFFNCSLKKTYDYILREIINLFQIPQNIIEARFKCSYPNIIHPKYLTNQHQPYKQQINHYKFLHYKIHLKIQNLFIICSKADGQIVSRLIDTETNQIVGIYSQSEEKKYIESLSQILKKKFKSLGTISVLLSSHRNYNIEQITEFENILEGKGSKDNITIMLKRQRFNNENDQKIESEGFSQTKYHHFKMKMPLKLTRQQQEQKMQNLIQFNKKNQVILKIIQKTQNQIFASTFLTNLYSFIFNNYLKEYKMDPNKNQIQNKISEYGLLILENVLEAKKKHQDKQTLLNKIRDGHFVELSPSQSKHCVYCSTPERKKKSNYRCDGCSITYGKDVTLCIDQCFEKYHKDMDQSIRKLSRKDYNKMKKHCRRLHEKDDVEAEDSCDQTQKQTQLKYDNFEDIIKNLRDQTQISKLARIQLAAKRLQRQQRLSKQPPKIPTQKQIYASNQYLLLQNKINALARVGEYCLQMLTHKKVKVQQLPVHKQYPQE